MNHRRGSALIIVLWVIGLLSLIVVSFAFEAHLESRITRFSRRRRQAEQLALSGMAIAEMLIDMRHSVTESEPPETAEDDRWHVSSLRLSRGLPVHRLRVPMGEGDLLLSIEPEPGRRNVNALSDEDWERILEVGGIPEERWPVLIDSVADWIDADDRPRLHGAETEDYYALLDPPYRAKNAPLDSVRELLLVRGFNDAILSGGVINPDEPHAEPIHVRGIQDLLTTYGDGKVNVNSAGRNVLMTLPGVDEIVAGAIIEERSGQGMPESDEEDFAFNDVSDFMSRIPGLDPAVSEMVTTSSDYYRITSIGVVARVTRRIWTIVHEDDRALHTLRWREEP